VNHVVGTKLPLVCITLKLHKKYTDTIVSVNNENIPAFKLEGGHIRRLSNFGMCQWHELHLEISVYVYCPIAPFPDSRCDQTLSPVSTLNLHWRANVLFTAINWPSLLTPGNRACKCNLFGWFQLKNCKPFGGSVCMEIQINKSHKVFSQ